MFRVRDFFDINEFPFNALFQGVDAVWDVLGLIGPFLEAWEDFTIAGTVMPGATLQGDRIAVGRGTVIEPDVFIKGKVLIGNDCEIRQGAYIRGNVIVGHGCVVGHTTEVKNSVFLNGAKAAHFAYVGDSILGNGVNLGAGTKLANFKIDTGSRGVAVTVEGGRRDTGLRKMGAVLGDGVELGCNCVTMPGALIGPGALVYPNTTIRGAVPPRTLVKTRQACELTPRLV